MLLHCRSIWQPQTQRVRSKILHYLQFAIAWLLVLIGVAFLFSPIPLGLFFLSVGLAILIYLSEPLQLRIHGYRSTHPSFNQRIIRVENALENRLRFISLSLQKTRPIPPGQD